MPVAITDMRAKLDPIVEKHRGKRGVAVPLLVDKQNEIGCAARGNVSFVEKKLSIPLSGLWGVTKFETQQNFTRRGQNIIRVSCGSVCCVSSSRKRPDAINNRMSCPENGAAEDLRFPQKPVTSFGACGLVPAMVVSDQAIGRLASETVRDLFTLFL